MKPILVTIGRELPLLVIPDSDAHMDGHPVLTYTYSIFRQEEPGGVPDFDRPETLIGPQKKADPRYMGYITFEQPGKLFTYTADGHYDLSSEQVEQVIEHISEYRDSPQMWSIED